MTEALVARPEADFTPPSHWCPRPDLWSAYDPDTAEVEVIELVVAFVRGLKPELVLETGTGHGVTAERIGRALVANGHGRLVTIEIDPPRAEAARRRCAGLPVEVVTGDSCAWTPPGPIGLAWLDSHLDLRHRELLRYRPWLQGAIVGIHDAGPRHSVWGHLEREVGSWFQRIRLRTPRGVVFGEVTA
jgi:hypothetical protein